VLFALLTGNRFSYFHALFPQPVTAKMGGSIITKIICGLIYFRKSAHQYPVFILLCILFAAASAREFAGLVRRRQGAREPRLLLICFVAAYGLFVAASGGDWMDGARFFVPILAPILIVACSLCVPLAGRTGTIATGIVLNVTVLVYFAATLSTAAPLMFYDRYVGAAEAGKRFSFFERANREHFRNIPVIQALEQVVDRMVAAGIHPQIMSIQAGMIPYHVFSEYYGKVSFVDFRGLSTTELTDCALTDELPKSHYGVGISYDWFFAHFDVLSRECGLRRPEIIFDLNHVSRNRHIPIEKAGYTIVYYQKGRVARHSLLPGREVNYDELIAVRSDIAERLGLTSKNIELH
jgi:hypothetical protein